MWIVGLSGSTRQGIFNEEPCLLKKSTEIANCKIHSQFSSRPDRDLSPSILISESRFLGARAKWLVVGCWKVSHLPPGLPIFLIMIIVSEDVITRSSPRCGTVVDLCVSCQSSLRCNAKKNHNYNLTNLEQVILVLAFQ